MQSDVPERNDTHARPHGATAPAPALTGRLTAVLAVACGVAVASLYYSQPLLHTIAKSFGTGAGTAGLVVTLAQVGFAVGLALFVPLGDLWARRRLVPAVLVATAAALAASAVAPSIGVLILLSTVVGLGSVAAQILVPLAASLASDADRGRVVGTVMSGLLIGILLARTLSGLVAGAAGWRAVYWAAAALVLVTALALARLLPPEGHRPALDYGRLLSSTVSLFASEALLRRRAAFGALAFASFSVFWTTVAFMLAGPPYHYGDTVIGLFGLVGAAGATCASFAGRWADKGWTRSTTTLFAVAMAVSFVPIFLGLHHGLGWFIPGVVILDLGIQGLHVTNQSLIYRLAPEARSRVTSAYMVCYFAGGALGSAVSGGVYASSGWAGVCVLGGAIGVVAVLGALLDVEWPVRPRPPLVARRQGQPAGAERPDTGVVDAGAIDPG